MKRPKKAVRPPEKTETVAVKLAVSNLMLIEALQQARQSYRKLSGEFVISQAKCEGLQAEIVALRDALEKVNRERCE